MLRIPESAILILNGLKAGEGEGAGGDVETCVLETWEGRTQKHSKDKDRVRSSVQKL